MLANTFRTLLGLSIGDAYGIHFEFMSQEDIADSYLEKPQTSLGGGPFQFLPGDFSDDTEMALLTLYSLMQKRYVIHITSKHFIRYGRIMLKMLVFRRKEHCSKALLIQKVKAMVP